MYIQVESCEYCIGLSIVSELLQMPIQPLGFDNHGEVSSVS